MNHLKTLHHSSVRWPLLENFFIFCSRLFSLNYLSVDCPVTFQRSLYPTLTPAKWWTNFSVKHKNSIDQELNKLARMQLEECRCISWSALCKLMSVLVLKALEQNFRHRSYVFDVVMQNWLGSKHCNQVIGNNDECSRIIQTFNASQGDACRVTLIAD